MNRQQKNSMIENYILKKVSSVNKQYPNMINQDRLARAIKMFKDLDEDYEMITLKIDSLLSQAVDAYRNMPKQTLSDEEKKEEAFSKTFYCSERLSLLESKSLLNKAKLNNNTAKANGRVYKQSKYVPQKAGFVDVLTLGLILIMGVIFIIILYPY